MKKKLLKKRRNSSRAKRKAAPWEANVKRWQRFYEEVFSGEFEAEKLKVARPKDGFDHLIVVKNGITLDQVFEACKKRFPIVRHSADFSTDIPQNARTPEHSYAVWVRRHEESDAELGNFSADDLAKKKVPTETLLEHLLFELEYFCRTGKHLDAKDITLCAGSRYKNGRVPTTISHQGEFKIHWAGSTEKNPRLRARRVIAK